MATALWLLAAVSLLAIHAALTLAIHPVEPGVVGDANLGMAVAPVLFAAIWALSGESRRNLGSFARAVCVIAGLASVGMLGQFAGREPGPATVFASSAGRFSVLAPVSLTEKVEDLDLGHGIHVKMHTFAGERRDVAYIASYVDYPANLVAASSPEEMLDGAVQGQSQQPGARLVSTDSIQLGEYPGRSVQLEDDSQGYQFTMRLRSYFVGNRLYQIITVQKRGAPDAKPAQEFLSSFKLAGARDTRPAAGRIAR